MSRESNNSEELPVATWKKIDQLKEVDVIEADNFSGFSFTLVGSRIYATGYEHLLTTPFPNFYVLDLSQKKWSSYIRPCW